MNFSKDAKLMMNEMKFEQQNLGKQQQYLTEGKINFAMNMFSRNPIKISKRLQGSPKLSEINKLHICTFCQKKFAR